MKRSVVLVALVAPALVGGACGSYDTGGGPGGEAEQACHDTIEAFARAAERCGEDYKAAYERLLRRDANGDCKNVRTIRDETALRGACIPFVATQPCDDRRAGNMDPSCARQLQRPL